MTDDLKAAIALGTELYEAGRCDEAFDHFLGLRIAHPHAADVWLNSAFTLDRAGREHDAIPFYLQALELGLEGQDRRDALVCLASSLRNTGRAGEAVATLGEARTAFSGDLVVDLFLALALCDAHRETEAVKTLADAIFREVNELSIEPYGAILRRYFGSLG